jgi:hypothetical protein
VYVANEVRDELVTEAFLQQLAVDFQVPTRSADALDLTTHVLRLDVHRK